MKDCHSHLLYGIDDGSKSLEESISLLKEMEKAGTKELILTPHYVENSKYNCNNTNKMKLFKTLQKEAKENNIDIKLYLGNEVFFTANFIELIKKKEIRTLNNTKYLLFEFPMSQVYFHTGLEVCHDLIGRGFVPILAHPERYPDFQKNPKALEEFVKAGILMQGNFTSLFRKYGRVPQKTLKYFLKRKWITLLGSDTHHEVKYSREKLDKKLLRITKDKEYVDALLGNNFDKVIQNEDIGMIR